MEIPGQDCLEERDTTGIPRQEQITTFIPENAKEKKIWTSPMKVSRTYPADG
jgi:hypothetical protein